MVIAVTSFQPDHQELFEERAAIMEFEAGMTREEAERKARIDIACIVARECRKGDHPGPGPAFLA